MIFDLINSFGNYFKDTKIVLDSYKLQNGIYILFKNDGTHEVLKVDKDTNITSSLYEYLKVRDLYSNYINCDKAINTSYVEPIDGKKYKLAKKIYSNNQYTLFFKNRFVEGLISEEKETIPVTVFVKAIDKYFESLVVLGTKNKKEKLLLEQIQNDISSSEEILANKEVMKERFLDAVEIVKTYHLVKDTLIKVFLEAEVNMYERASIKYTCIRIFNKNDNNIQIGDKLYGINNYNFDYNSDKPFMELKSTPFKVPSMISLDYIKIVRNLYIWLLNNVANKNFVKIPLSYDFSNEPDKIDKMKTKQNPVYLLKVITKKGIPKIEDFCFIPFYSTEISTFRCINCFETKSYSTENEFTTKNIYELENWTSKIWFSDKLKDSYGDPEKIDEMKASLSSWQKRLLKINTNIFLEFFHKSNSLPLKQNLDKIAYSVCYNMLINSSKNNDEKDYAINNCAKCMNLWIAFDEYFGGDFKMIKNKIYEKSKEVVLNNGEFDSDEMYFFFVGQVVKYLLDKSKVSNKTQSMIDSVMRAGNQEKLLNIILLLRDKYSHELRLSNPRFDNVLKQILTDVTDKDVVKNRKYILAGFLEENLFYLKSNKEDTEAVSENI